MPNLETLEKIKSENRLQKHNPKATFVPAIQEETATQTTTPDQNTPQQITNAEIDHELLAQNLAKNLAALSITPSQNTYPQAPNVEIDYDLLAQSIANNPKFTLHSNEAMPDKCAQSLLRVKQNIAFEGRIKEVTQNDSKRVEDLKRELEVIYKTAGSLKEDKENYEYYQNLQENRVDKVSKLPTTSKERKHLNSNKDYIFSIMSSLESGIKAREDFLSESVKGANSPHYRPTQDISKIKSIVANARDDESLNDLIKDYCNKCSNNYNELPNTDALIVTGVCAIYYLYELEIFN